MLDAMLSIWRPTMMQCMCCAKRKGNLKTRLAYMQLYCDECCEAVAKFSMGTYQSLFQFFAIVNGMCKGGHR